MCKNPGIMGNGEQAVETPATLSAATGATSAGEPASVQPAETSSPRKERGDGPGDSTFAPAETVLQERVALLRKTRLSPGLTDELALAMASAMEPLHHGPGEVLIRRKEPGSRLYVLVSGRVEVRVPSPQGGEIVIASLTEGDCFGEMSLLTDEPTSADVVAVQDAETLMLARPAFAELIARNPAALKGFITILSRRLRSTDDAASAALERERELAVFLQRERESPHHGDLIGKHASIRSLDREIDKRAATDLPLLISGERGTGKELVARHVHRRSLRKEAPLLTAKCSQISESPWGDKLFGACGGPAGSGVAPGGVCYIDLAEGGTLLLHNVELLPPAIQEKLAAFLCLRSGSLAAPNVRIIATTTCTPAELEQGGRLVASLAQAFSGQTLVVPPLRARKKDIGDLARYFLQKHAEHLNKNVTEIDSHALTALVSYDFAIANVAELKETVERAVVLAEDSTVRAEEIFVGPPPKKNPLCFHLLHEPTPKVKWAVQATLLAGRIFVGVFFAALLAWCFVTPWVGGEAIATALVWSLWWPALAVSFFFLGRAWCAVCPMASVAGLVQHVRSLNLRIPAWLKENDAYVTAAGFFLILWIEEASGMRHSAPATGLLLVGIGTGAAVTALLFPRRTWCRHLCPLGGLAGLCSTSAVVELRPTADVCAARCFGHTCYKGDEKTEGCPMFNHVMFVGSNQHCSLCMKCISACPNGSPQFNLRLPARELCTPDAAGRPLGVFVAMLLGLTASLLTLQHWELTGAGPLTDLSETGRFLTVTGIMGLGAGLPVLLATVWAKIRSKSLETGRADRFWKALAACTPLVFAAFAGYQLGYAPGLADLEATIGFRPTGALSTFSLLAVIRGTLLTAGLVVTLLVLRQLTPSEDSTGEKRWMRDRILSSAGALACWAILLAWVVRPPGWPL